MRLSILAGSLLLSLSAALPAQAPIAVDPAGKSVKWGPCPPIFATGCEIAVLRGDPALPNADVLLRVRGGSPLGWHRHTSAERMILLGGQLRVEYQGSKPVVLKRGDYAFGPAGLAHRASCLGTGPCTLFIAFEGPVDAVAVDTPARR
jgi:quercetin dioxygenase-like cupin family protein